jgi:RNA polymerase sigma factor (sigma-70 family)
MGETDRLAQLVMERLAALTLFARQWLDSSSAEDAVQEALTSLLMQRKSPDDPVAWMFRAVRNGAIDHCRTTANRRRREQSVAEARGEWFEARIDAALDARSAEQALKQLDPMDRQIIVLRIWGDLGLAAIARIMEMGTTTVHDRYAAALEQLRTALEKPCKRTTP